MFENIEGSASEIAKKVGHKSLVDVSTITGTSVSGLVFMRNNNINKFMALCFGSLHIKQLNSHKEL